MSMLVIPIVALAVKSEGCYSINIISPVIPFKKILPGRNVKESYGEFKP